MQGKVGVLSPLNVTRIRDETDQVLNFWVQIVNLYKAFKLTTHGRLAHNGIANAAGGSLDGGPRISEGVARPIGAWNNGNSQL